MIRSLAIIASLAGVVYLPGCRAEDHLAGLSSAEPRQRATAALHAGQQGDWQAVPLLVDRLEDPDAAVRFYAIEALRRITGQDQGYVYYQNEAERAHAVQRWRNFLRERFAEPQHELLAETNPEGAP